MPYTLSTLSTRSIEEVRSVSAGRLWFQVYAWRDRGLVAEMVQRAADADYEALVLTVDTAVFGRRERDVRRGFSLPPAIGLGTVIDGARHPGWTVSFVRSADEFAMQGGRIRVDDERRTSVTGVWAGGDCIFGGEDLTVAAVEDGKVAAESISRALSE